MTLYKNKYRVESNRWQFWDYSSPGSYFITVCVENRKHILGRIENEKMILSDCGKIVSRYFTELPTYHKRIILDEQTIMPNHFHCIITLGDYNFDNRVSDVGGGADKIHEFYLWYKQLKSPTENDIKQYRKLRRKMLIPKILGKFKMQTSQQINILKNTPGNKNWQSDYHDHLIRNDAEFQRIKKYIRDNPLHWEEDKFNK